MTIEAIQEMCMIEGRCPVCGVTGEMVFTATCLQVIWRHEPPCPAALDADEELPTA